MCVCQYWRAHGPRFKNNVFMDWGKIGLSALSGFADSAIGAGMDALFGGISVRRQRDAQADLMHLQNRLQEEQWNRENAYNEEIYNRYHSPSAMVKQYKEAGLNPAALAGGATSQVAEATGSVGGALGVAPPPTTRSGFSALSSAYMLAQIENIKAQTKNVDADTDNIVQRTDHESQMFPLLRSSEEARASLMRAQEEVQKSEKLSLNAKTAWQNLVNLILENTKDNQIELSKTQLETAQADLRVALVSANEADKRGERLDDFVQAELDQMTAQVWMMSASAKYNEQLADTEAHRTETAKFEKFIMSRENWRDQMRNLYEASIDGSGNRRIIKQLEADYEATLAESEARSEIAEHEANDFAIWLREMSSIAGIIIGTGISVFAGRGRDPKPAKPFTVSRRKNF